jgi:hypothetical protein
MREGGGGEPGLVLPGTFRQPRLVVLDVAAGQLRGGGHLRCGLDQKRSEGAEGEVSAGDAARPKPACDLVEIAAHRIDDLRMRGEVFPGGSSSGPLTGRSR